MPAGHVFGLGAEREGIDALRLMEKLRVMWKGQDGWVSALDDMLDETRWVTSPVHRAGWDTPAGNRRAVATQGVQVPS